MDSLRICRECGQTLIAGNCPQCEDEAFCRFCGEVLTDSEEVCMNCDIEYFALQSLDCSPT